jgi:hypothetical protein
MMIEASQRMIRMNSQGEVELGGMSPPLKRHLELEKIQYSLEHFKVERVGFEQYSSPFTATASLDSY